MRNKKGQVEQLIPLVTTLVGIAVVLVVGFLIMAQIKTQAISNIDSASITGESVTWSNNTNVAFGVSTALVEASCSQISNGTGGIVINSGNYTCGTLGLNLTDNADYNWASGVIVNYSYKNASFATNGTGATQNALQDIPGWLPIIVVTIIGALLLGLVRLFRQS